MLEKVKNTILEYIDYDKDAITEDTEFVKDLKMTSYDIVTMVGQLEEEFDINIDTEELEKIVTVGDLAKYLSKNT